MVAIHFGAFVPVVQPDFDRSVLKFGGLRSAQAERLGSRWRVCEVIADRAERLAESICQKSMLWPSASSNSPLSD